MISARDDFFFLGTLTTVSKTIQAPLERVKLLVQCQQEIAFKFQDALSIGQDDKRVYAPHRNLNAREMLRRLMKDEAYATTLFRGNLSNVLRYVPSQLALLSVRDALNANLLFPRDRGYKKWLFTSVLSGGLAGVCSQLFAHPFDFVRTRLAVDLASEGNKFEFNRSRDLVKAVVRTRGFRALYTGFLISCGGIFIFRGVYFGLYDALRVAVEPETMLGKLMIGYVSTFVGTVLAYPCDTVRRRMMSGGVLDINTPKKYKNAWSTFQKIIGREGVSALFRGSTINVVRHVTGAVVLVGYDVYLARQLAADQQKK